MSWERENEWPKRLHNFFLLFFRLMQKKYTFALVIYSFRSFLWQYSKICISNVNAYCWLLMLMLAALFSSSFVSRFFLLIKKFHIFFGTASKMIPIDGELLPLCSWRLLWVCNFCTNSIFKWWLCATLCKKKKFTFFFFSESTQNGTN